MELLVDALNTLRVKLRILRQLKNLRRNIRPHPLCLAELAGLNDFFNNTANRFTDPGYTVRSPPLLTTSSILSLSVLRVLAARRYALTLKGFSP
jgi:hypothetical protein